MSQHGTATGRREALLWLVVLSVPPGIGMVGFVAVAMAGGAVSTEAVAAGVATTLVIGGLVYVMLQSGAENPERESP